MTHNEGTNDGEPQTIIYMAPPSGTPERDPLIPGVHERHVNVHCFRVLSIPVGRDEREQQVHKKTR